MTAFEKSRKFIYQNARPVDLARWQYFFEGGSQEAVLTALAAYQNEDGGFGYGLEADCFNPKSAPIQTWAATEILRQIGYEDRNHPIIRGILRYLSSGLDFDREQMQWMNTVPSNNDYPHAIWWTYREGKVEYKYNPTACLAGFFLKYGDRECAFYRTTLRIAKEAYRFWAASMPYTEQHVTSCFIRLYEYCRDADLEIVDMEEFRQKLTEQVRYELLSAADQWETNYVCMPSNFIESKESIFQAGNEDLIAKECVFIRESQLEDGAFTVPWKWWNEYPEFEIAKTWWKGDFCIRNVEFLREFDE